MGVLERLLLDPHPIKDVAGAALIVGSLLLAAYLQIGIWNGDLLASPAAITGR